MDNFDDYIDPVIRPEKDLTLKKIPGSAEERRPNRYRIGDKVVKGVQLGDAPVGLGNQGPKPRNRFTVPGTNKMINWYLDNGSPYGGSNKSAWDKDDIKWGDRFLISPEDITNAQTNRTYQELEEEFKNRRFAGEKVKVYWGDTRESVENRIKMMQDVATKRQTEPERVQDQLENARILGEAQNSGIRAENTANRNDAFTKNRFMYMERKDSRQREQDRQRAERLEKKDNLRYEERLQNDLRREREQIQRDQRNFDFQMRKYEDMLERADERQEKEDRRYLMKSISDAFSSLGAFF